MTVKRRSVWFDDDDWRVLVKRAGDRSKSVSAYLRTLMDNPVVPPGVASIASAAIPLDPEQITLTEVAVVADTPGNRAAGAISFPKATGAKGRRREHPVVLPEAGGRSDPQPAQPVDDVYARRRAERADRFCPAPKPPPKEKPARRR